VSWSVPHPCGLKVSATGAVPASDVPPLIGIARPRHRRAAAGAGGPLRGSSSAGLIHAHGCPMGLSLPCHRHVVSARGFRFASPLTRPETTCGPMPRIHRHFRTLPPPSSGHPACSSTGSTPAAGLPAGRRCAAVARGFEDSAAPRGSHDGRRTLPEPA
jgi:hypothetical protein